MGSEWEDFIENNNDSDNKFDNDNNIDDDDDFYKDNDIIMTMTMTIHDLISAYSY